MSKTQTIQEFLDKEEPAKLYYLFSSQESKHVVATSLLRRLYSEEELKRGCYQVRHKNRGFVLNLNGTTHRFKIKKEQIIQELKKLIDTQHLTDGQEPDTINDFIVEPFDYVEQLHTSLIFKSCEIIYGNIRTTLALVN